MNNKKKLNMDISGLGMNNKLNTKVIKNLWFKKFCLFLIFIIWTSVSAASRPGAPVGLSIDETVSNDYRWVVSWQRSNTGGAPTRYELEQSIRGGAYETVYTGLNRGRTILPRTSLDDPLKYLASWYGGFFSLFEGINGLYRYRVRACNASGCSPYSQTSSVTLDFLEPGLTFSVESNVYSDSHVLNISTGLSWLRLYGEASRYITEGRPSVYSITQHNLTTGDLREIYVAGNNNLNNSHPVVETISDSRFRVRGTEPGDYSYSFVVKLDHY